MAVRHDLFNIAYAGLALRYYKICGERHATELPDHKRGHTKNQRHTCTKSWIPKGQNYMKNVLKSNT